MFECMILHLEFPIKLGDASQSQEEENKEPLEAMFFIL